MSNILKRDVDWDFANYRPKSDKELIEVCLPSKLWRMNNLYHVRNKQGNIVLFKMNHSQRKVAECAHNRKIILKSRQQGISTYHLLYNVDEAIFYPNLTNGVLAQGLEEASDLLTKAKLAWELLDPCVKEFLDITVVRDNESTLELSNGSRLLVRTSFRSGTLQNLHVSELGKISVRDPKKAKELKTGTFQAIGDKRKVTVESTAEGRSGYFYELWQTAEQKLISGEKFSELEFYPIFLSWMEDPDCTLDMDQVISEEMQEYFNNIESSLNIKLTKQQKNFYIVKKRELGDDMTQEYPSTPEEAFASAKDGSFYGESMKQLRLRNRIQPNLYTPQLPVYVAMDLGVRDLMALVFWQNLGNETRIIDELVLEGSDIKTVCKALHSKPYKYAEVFGPHDTKQRELGSGKTRFEVFLRYGVYINVLKKTIIADGINAVRMMLTHTFIDSKCVHVIEALDNYSKQWDEVNGVWMKEPLHNKYSHMADAVRYMAVSRAVSLDSSEELEFTEEDFEDEFDRFLFSDNGFAI